MTYKILIASGLLLTLTGCGAENSNKDRVMEVGEFYSVSKGDVIVKASDEALVKITHISSKDTATVSLLEGNATITHPTKSSN